MEGILLVISGPSGVGKGTIIKKMLENELNCCPCYFSVSMTTRTPRKGEVDGQHYHFVTREFFEQSIQDDAFLEYARYADNYYGTPRAPLQKQVDEGGCAILDIEVQGMLQVRRRAKDCVTVFITPPSWAALESRLRDRNSESACRIEKRLTIARQEWKLRGEYQYLIVNEHIDTAAKDLAAIIRAERLRMGRMQSEIAAL